jgi:hypothetical protein
MTPEHLFIKAIGFIIFLALVVYLVLDDEPVKTRSHGKAEH